MSSSLSVQVLVICSLLLSAHLLWGKCYRYSNVFDNCLGFAGHQVLCQEHTRISQLPGLCPQGPGTHVRAVCWRLECVYCLPCLLGTGKRTNLHLVWGLENV